MNLDLATGWQFHYRRIPAVEDWRQGPGHSLHATIVNHTGQYG
jgi:hypothetical protein